MKNIRCDEDRDDIFYNRLSSFLFRKGRLDTKKISTLKPRVYYVETFNNGLLVLKAHKSKESVAQQWSFFNKIKGRGSNSVLFKLFPNGKEVIECNTYIWTISPYMSGKKVNYRSSEERRSVVAALKKFHKCATGIKIKPMKKNTLITERWYNRLNTFKKTEYIFIENGFENLYMDIVHLTEKYLLKLSRLPWSISEMKAIERGTWIHGDVASHNFIINKQIYLIDFDLLACRPQIYDFIQLSQRFLPYIQWNLDSLLAYEMTNSENMRRFLLGTLLPTDVIREWIYFISHKSNQAILNYLVKMDLKWEKRKIFSQRADIVLKLI